MNERIDLDLERRLAAWLADERGSVPPEAGVHDILAATSSRRPLPRWLALIKEPPMRTASRVAVGSPTVRLVSILAATLLLALAASGAAMAGASLLAGPAIHVVDPSDSSAYQTVSTAIAAAQDGDTVLVKPGTYEESLLITTDITLLGEGGRDAVILRFPPDAPTATMQAGTPWAVTLPVGLWIDGTHAVIRGVTVSGAAPGMGIFIDGGDPAIEDVVIDVEGTDSADRLPERVAVLLHGGSRPTISGSAWDDYFAAREGSSPTIERNTISGIGGLSLDGPGPATVTSNKFTAGAGMSASGGLTGTIADNVLEGGEIVIDTGADMLVRGNTATGVQKPAEGAIVVTGGGSRARIIDNRVTGSSSAIVVSSGAQAIVEGNELTGNGLGVSVVTAATTTVRENAIYGGGTGVLVGTGGPVIEGNTIESNEIGVSLGTTAAPVLSGNRFCGNGETVRVTGEHPVTLEGNEICPEDVAAAAK